MGIDIIGNREKAVAIIELRKGGGAKKVAADIIAKHKNVRSVLAKASPRYGVYRKRKLRVVLGSKNTEVTHAENGLRFRIDPRKVYFSPREATERMRVAMQVRAGESICVFFAGAGPLAITVAKKACARVTSIEINPSAVAYHKENNKLNKADVDVIKGDVAKVAKKLDRKFDRIAMPLPESALKYVPHALSCLKKGGICHLYCFCEEGKEKQLGEKIKNAAKKSKRKATLLRIQRVLPYGPRIWKMRVDFKAV